MQEKLNVAPVMNSWSEFEKHSELLEFLWQSLKLKESGEGGWEYLNFSSNLSTWDLPIDDGSIGVSISVTTSSEDDEKITSFTIALKDKSIYELFEINQFLLKLKSNYDLNVE